MERGDEMDKEEYKKIEQLDMRMHKYQFRYLRHLIDRAGLYKGEPRLILTIVKEEGHTQAELAKILCIKPATLTVMIQRMEAAGLIQRKTDEKDLRLLRVYSTSKGREISKKTETIFLDAICTIFEGIEEKDLIVYKNVLEKITERLKAYCEKEQKAGKKEKT